MLRREGEGITAGLALLSSRLSHCLRWVSRFASTPRTSINPMTPYGGGAAATATATPGGSTKGTTRLRETRLPALIPRRESERSCVTPGALPAIAAVGRRGYLHCRCLRRSNDGAAAADAARVVKGRAPVILVCGNRPVQWSLQESSRSGD